MAPRSDGQRRSLFLERHRSLLENMLQVTREQRRYLIEGDLRGLEQTNRLLAALVDSHRALHEDCPEPDEVADHRVLADLRGLAQQLQRESRTNYVLACRGGEFARHFLAILSGAPETESPSDRPDARYRRSPRLIDRPA